MSPRRTTRPNTCRSSIRPTSSIGSRRGSVFPRGPSPPMVRCRGPQQWPISGRLRYTRSEANIGSSSQPASRRTHWRSAWRAVPSPTGPSINNGRPLISGRAIQHDGRDSATKGAPAEHVGGESRRASPVRRHRTARPSSSGGETRTASGRAPWRCCCASTPELIGRVFETREKIAAAARSPPPAFPWANLPAADDSLLRHAAFDRSGTGQLNSCGESALVEFGLASPRDSSNREECRRRSAPDFIAEDGRSLGRR